MRWRLRFCRTGRAVARTDVFSATAARMNAFNASSDRVALVEVDGAPGVASRLGLRRRDGSSNAAPLVKVDFRPFS
jgi:hypothetical protein